ncbi:Uncharacterised protein [Enterobacter cloacae]|uniref:Uncharacterized protein n=1 Tax=Enterobacter cloacae TaxID=550 RepID=A0A377M8W0_ENTCL|nr:Uncharacterised protein [Enterobacter cloacae]
MIIDITPEGFSCRDDGRGFASYDDVKRYFGRFGTPHQEGDATYGRFRLGRGQIMAHARTLWRSQRWQMSVDTREMGYHYDLEELTQPIQGCIISGEWYEPLTSQGVCPASRKSATWYAIRPSRYISTAPSLPGIRRWKVGYGGR